MQISLDQFLHQDGPGGLLLQDQGASQEFLGQAVQGAGYDPIQFQTLQMGVLFFIGGLFKKTVFYFVSPVNYPGV